MKRFLIATILILAAGCVATTLAEEPAALPKAKPLKLEHNAGQLEPGPRYDYTFPIRNDGQAPLEIRRAEADCMCVDPSFDPVIAPGKTGSVRIRFDTKGRVGVMRKHVTVETNDPAQPTFVLTLNAMLRLPVEVSPGDEVMLPLTRGGSTELELTLHATQGRTLTLGPIRSSHPQLRPRVLSRAEVEGRIAEDLARTQIVVVNVPPALASKAFDATLRIPTNNPKRPIIQVRIHGYPQTAVAALPPRLYLGEVKGTMEKPLFVVLTLQRRQGSFKVLGTEATDKNLRLQVSMERPDHWEVVAVYDGGWPKGIHEGVITIRTDDPQRPVVKVPYRAEVS